MKINEVAKLTGVTVRTLHYYDKIGLLKPSEVTEAGYRLYNQKCLEVLQQILFFRELDFPLNEIREIMQNPTYDKEEALIKQKDLLLKKRKRLDNLIQLVSDTIEGVNDMSFEAFDMEEIEKTKNEYAQEIKERWGKTDAYAESQKKTGSYGKAQWNELNEAGNQILSEFAKIKDTDPASAEAQELVKKWQDYISKYFYHCTNEILSGLGLMYTGDERFTKNIDKNGEGTALFLSKAIAIYCGE